MSRPPRPLAASALAAGLLAVVLGGAACSSSGSHGGSPAPKPLPTTAPALPDQLPKTASALAHLMADGLIATGSAHVTINATGAATSSMSGSGGVTMVNGKITGLDLTGDVGTLHGVRVIEVNSVTYGRLPHPARADRPWSAIPARGGATDVRSVRSAIAATEQLVAPANVLALTTAGHASLQGAGKIAGNAALHYSVTTTVTDLPKTATLRALLAKQGVRSVHLDLWIDGAGRPLTVKDTPSPAGGPSGTVQFRDYNHPVGVQAPSATAIARG